MECTYIPYSSNVYYSPSPGSYAIIRLNPVEMIRPFNDTQALLEAQAMRPKSYLIMLQMVRFQSQLSLVYVAHGRNTGVGASVAKSTVVQIRG